MIFFFNCDWILWLNIVWKGVETKIKHHVYPILIQPTRVVELKKIEETCDAVVIGVGVTLTELESILQHQINTKHGIILATASVIHKWYIHDYVHNLTKFHCRIENENFSKHSEYVTFICRETNTQCCSE